MKVKEKKKKGTVRSHCRKTKTGTGRCKGGVGTARNNKAKFKITGRALVKRHPRK